MDSRGSTHRNSDALSKGDDRPNASARLLGSHSPALLFSDAGFRDRPVGQPSAPQARNSQQVLETYLRPLIGGAADAVSKQLIARFGTVARAIEASPEALADALAGHESAAAAIFAARRLMQFAANEQLVGSPVQAADMRFHAYLRAMLQHPVEERMHAIFLDRNDIFIAGENVARGSAGALMMRVRHVVHRALDLCASRILIAHNHPSGSSMPSEVDRRSTQDFIAIANAIDLEIVDHLIVTTDEIYSMRKGRAL